MKLQEIKQAISEGKKVYWANELYEVQKHGDKYYIVCVSNDNTIGLTWQDGETMNGKETDFFCK
jgi:predicted RecA/RadA family phage recombinase